MGHVSELGGPGDNVHVSFTWCSLIKLYLTQDVRCIHREAPATMRVSKEVTTAPPRKVWLSIGLRVYVSIGLGFRV